MSHPITVVLTTTQTTIAFIAMIIALLNLGWTIYSKRKDWDTAEDERRRKDTENATAAANAVTRQEHEDLKRRLDNAVQRQTQSSEEHNLLKNAHDQLKNSRLQHAKYINLKLNEFDEKLKLLEKSQCRCNAAQLKELIDDVQALKSENDQLEKDSLTEATDKLTEVTKSLTEATTTLTESYKGAITMHDKLEEEVSGLKDTISNIKGCECGKDKKAVKASGVSTKQEGEPLRRIHSSKSAETKSTGKPRFSAVV